MIKKHTEFIDNIEVLTERKMKAISVRARNPKMVKDIVEYINRMTKVQKERVRRSKNTEKINRTEMIT